METSKEFSIFGSSGFIGSNFTKMYPNSLSIPRNEREPLSKNILYFISTVDNYNIYDDLCLDVDTNLKVLCEVLNHCKDKDITFNFISSWFVYGQIDSLPAKEDYICNPTGFYSITKKCAEDLLMSFCKTYKIKYRIIRLCNVLGKGDKGVSRKKNAITWMINRLKVNEAIELYNNGLPLRDIMHVYDICKAIHLICMSAQTNQIYNVGSGKPIKIGTLINMAKKELLSKSRISYIESPIFHKQVQTDDFWMDVNKLSSLGFERRYSTKEIIKELCR